MYSEVFCRVYNEFGWNYYPEAFGQQLLQWLKQNGLRPKTAMDLACGTGVLCRLLKEGGIDASGMDLSAGMIAIARESDPSISYDVADMVTFRPRRQFDLVTCTGDALNHISDLEAVEKILENVHSYLQPGGYFVFDLLRESEISDSEPFEMDFSDTVKVRFQMLRPEPDRVVLNIRVWEDGVFRFEENIRETLRDPELICRMLEAVGFAHVTCADRLLPENAPGTTWFITAQKPE